MTEGEQTVPISRDQMTPRIEALASTIGNRVKFFLDQYNQGQIGREEVEHMAAAEIGIALNTIDAEGRGLKKE